MKDLPVLLEQQSNISAKPVYGSNVSEHGAISWLVPNWVHERVREIHNIAANQDIFHSDKTSLGI